MPDNTDQAIWDVVNHHIKSIFDGDTHIYTETTSADLSLYEWYVTPHRQDGLDFHLFMVEHHHGGATDDYRVDLLEPRLQRYGDTAIVCYTMMLTRITAGGITHRVHNESRVLIQRDGKWQVVHVHKSPTWKAAFEKE